MIYEILESYGINIGQWFKLVYKDGSSDHDQLEDVPLAWIKEIHTQEGYVFEVLEGPPYLKLKDEQ
jgi:hypothetical protein